MKRTKEQERMDEILDKTFTAILHYLYEGCPLQEDVLFKVREHDKLSHGSLYAHFLEILGVEYVVAKDSGEYTEFYWLQRDFTCIFISDNAM